MACPPPPPTSHRCICFSDIDGTLVHYLDDPSEVQELVGEMHWLPTSTTGRQGVISHASLEKAAALRRAGAAFAIVSGARTSTVLQRLPFLPAADAIVAENGGRIWFPDAGGLTACPLREDLEWRQQLAPVTGPLEQEGVPPLERQGVLWDFYRHLHQQGWKLDAGSYSTCFRMLSTPGRSQDDVQHAIDARPASLSSTVNLGVVDFYPAASGKEGAARRLMQLWRVPAARTAFLCDDDNDLPLAAVVGRAFLPSISAASVEAAVAADPGRFVVADTKWTGGTEQMLDAVAAWFAALDGSGAAAAAGPAAAGSAQQPQQQCR